MFWITTRGRVMSRWDETPGVGPAVRFMTKARQLLRRRIRNELNDMFSDVLCTGLLFQVVYCTSIIHKKKPRRENRSPLERAGSARLGNRGKMEKPLLMRGWVSMAVSSCASNVR